MQQAGTALLAPVRTQRQHADAHDTYSLRKHSDGTHSSKMAANSQDALYAVGAKPRVQKQQKQQHHGVRHTAGDHRSGKRRQQPRTVDTPFEAGVAVPPAIFDGGRCPRPTQHYIAHRCFTEPRQAYFAIKEDGKPAPLEPCHLAPGQTPQTHAKLVQRNVAQHGTRGRAGASPPRINAPPLLERQQRLLRLLLQLQHSKMGPGITRALKNAQSETVKMVSSLCRPVPIPRPPISARQVDPWVPCACESNPAATCTAPGLCIRKNGVRVCHVVDVEVLSHIQAYFPPTLQIASMARVQNPARKRAYLERRRADIKKLATSSGQGSVLGIGGPAADDDASDSAASAGAAAVMKGSLETEVHKDMELNTRVECRAFHCTTAKNINTIHVHGLRRECARMGTLGRAIYATPEPSKANRYFKSPGTGELRYMLGLRVLPGRLHTVSATGASFPFLEAPPQQCDSLTALRNGEQELAIFHNDRVLVEYIIGYHDLQDCPPSPVAHPLYAQAQLPTPTPPRSPPTGLCNGSSSSSNNSSSSNSSSSTVAPAIAMNQMATISRAIANHRSAKRGIHDTARPSIPAHGMVPQKRYKRSASPSPPPTPRPEPAAASLMPPAAAHP